MYPTREAWLKAGVKAVRPDFEKAGLKVPADLETIVSWPKGNKRAIGGQQFPASWSMDKKTNYIAISPVIIDPVMVLSILIHEMVHSAMPVRENHGKLFKAAAQSLGLVGPFKSSVPGDELKLKLMAWARKLDTYPHIQMLDHDSEKAPPEPKGRTQRAS